MSETGFEEGDVKVESLAKEKLKLSMPVAIKLAAILGLFTATQLFMGIHQNNFIHELTHDVRHALGYACH